MRSGWWSYPTMMFITWTFSIIISYIICEEARAVIQSYKDVHHLKQSDVHLFLSGFITCEEARAVIRSYNDVYHLNLSDDVIESAMHNCSNGLHVDYETLVQMLSLAKWWKSIEMRSLVMAPYTTAFCVRLNRGGDVKVCPPMPEKPWMLIVTDEAEAEEKPKRSFTG